MISVHESKELYKLNSDSIYIYTLLLWVAVYFYPMPIDLIFIVAIGYASQLAYKRTLDKKLFLPLFYHYPALKGKESLKPLNRLHKALVY